MNKYSTTAGQLATDKQLSFLHDLLKGRDIPVAGKDDTEAYNIERAFDVMGGKDISRIEASRLIDYLLSRPKVGAPASSEGPGAILAGLPLSKYAIRRADGVIIFYEVVQRKSGARFVNRLVGHPGDWKRYYLSRAAAATVAQQIAQDPKGAAKLFAEKHRVCAKCLSPLSDAVSIAAGLGPDCRKSF